MLPTGQLVIFSPLFFQSPIIFDQAKIANREMIRFKKSLSSKPVSIQLQLTTRLRNFSGGFDFCLKQRKILIHRS